MPILSTGITRPAEGRPGEGYGLATVPYVPRNVVVSDHAIGLNTPGTYTLCAEAQVGEQPADPAYPYLGAVLATSEPACVSFEITGSGWTAWNGHAYILTPEAMSWPDAAAFAESHGFRLVTINDAAEETWLQATFGTDPLWIGLNDRTVEGLWVWHDGSPVSYTHWDPNAPNGGIGENAAAMNQHPTLVWDDLPEESTTLRAVIERSVLY